MDATIITIYCLCEDFLKAMPHRRDDPQTRLSTAEVMTIPLVAATFFGGNIDQTRRFLHEYGYMKKMISKSHLNRRIHRIEPALWRVLFELLARVFVERNDPDQTYAVDSLPVPVCDNIRICRCRLYPLVEGEEGHDGTPKNKKPFRGYIASKRRYFYGLRVHLVVTGAGEPVEFALAAGSVADVTVFKELKTWTYPRVRSSVRTRPTPITTTKTSSRKWAYTLRPSARRTPRGRCQRGRSSWASRSAGTSKRSSAD